MIWRKRIRRVLLGNLDGLGLLLDVNSFTGDFRERKSVEP